MSENTEFGLLAFKRSRGNGLAKERDRISSLPESVRCHILSRLTAKEAVRTCVLSKSWEHKWTSIYNIHIDDSELYQTKSSKFFRIKSTKSNFLNFMERLLLVSENAKSFCLSCNEQHESSRMTSWICTIPRRKVENLDVMCAHGGVSLPHAFSAALHCIN